MKKCKHLFTAVDLKTGDVFCVKCFKRRTKKEREKLYSNWFSKLEHKLVILDLTDLTLKKNDNL